MHNEQTTQSGRTKDILGYNIEPSSKPVNEDTINTKYPVDYRAHFYVERSQVCIARLWKNDSEPQVKPKVILCGVIHQHHERKQAIRNWKEQKMKEF